MTTPMSIPDRIARAERARVLLAIYRNDPSIGPVPDGRASMPNRARRGTRTALRKRISVLVGKTNRTARERGLRGPGVTTQEMFDLLELCGYTCMVCGLRPVECSDHYTPAVAGTLHGIDYIQMTCRSCNCHKLAMLSMDTMSQVSYGMSDAAAMMSGFLNLGWEAMEAIRIPRMKARRRGQQDDWYTRLSSDQQALDDRNTEARARRADERKDDPTFKPHGAYTTKRKRAA